MSEFYILGIDQSTQGTKGILVNEHGDIVKQAYLAHRQIIDDAGYISHDPNEIYSHILKVCRDILYNDSIDISKLLCVSLTNQRETTVAFSKATGQPLANAIVWQCERAKDISKQYVDHAEEIYSKTGLKLSPYYPASKMKWLLKHVHLVQQALNKNDLALGTMDSYVIYRLTGAASFKTDFSNASRTQLFNIHTFTWDKYLCELFHIPLESLAEVVDSDAIFGYTDLEGILANKIPICGVMGDSHAALFAQNCLEKGDIKATYGTGSSIMLNTGKTCIQRKGGLSTSLAWRIRHEHCYVLEGNIHYTGAVISWLKDDIELIKSTNEIETLIEKADVLDTTYIVPAFSGLGAPYWRTDVNALICGMSRRTTKNEVIKAACESIAYQISDVITYIRKETGLPIKKLHVDGGPVSNQYLMQFQSDMAGLKVCIPNVKELSVFGVVYLAGVTFHKWTYGEIFRLIDYKEVVPTMEEDLKDKKLKGWQNAVKMLLKGNHNEK